MLSSQFEALQSKIASLPDADLSTNQVAAALPAEPTAPLYNQPNKTTPETQQRKDGPPSSLLSVLRSSNFTSYHGTEKERTSVKVRSFISGIRKVTTLCPTITDAQEVSIAACLLKDNADLWHSRSTQHGPFPTLAALQDAMLSEFVPANEIATARVNLIRLQFTSGSLESHITKFRHLVDICSTPVTEAFTVFQLSLPTLFKKKLSERFPDGRPSSMSDVYNYVRTVYISEKWSDSPHISITKSKQSKGKQKQQKSSPERPSDPSLIGKDPTADSWGPADIRKTAQDTAKLFEVHLFSKHGVPHTLVSDGDPKVTSRFWDTLTQLLNIRGNISSANHPQTDGQSEVMIRTLSSMLRSSLQSSPTDWDTMLPTLEFQYNSSRNSSTRLAPFEVSLGYIPHTPVTRTLQHCSERSQQAFDYVQRRKTMAQVAREHLATAVARQKHYADQRRQDVSFNRGDLVLLRADALSLVSRASLPTKWQPRFIGPFRIRERLGPVSYRIELPPTMRRAHDVFHVAKLRKFYSDQTGPLDIVIDNDGNVEQEVSIILDKKRFNRRVYYLAQFVGESEDDAVWLPRTSLRNCKELLQSFLRTKASMRTSSAKKGANVTHR